MLNHDGMANRLLWTAVRDAANADAPDAVWGAALCPAESPWHTVQERDSAEGRGAEKTGRASCVTDRMPVRNACKLEQSKEAKTLR